jgi:hypothetical protein
LGFLCKQYHGWSNWFYLYGGGVLYEIFWCLVFFLFWHKKKNIVTIAIAVLLVTCLLEILQLWHPPFLEVVRSTFPGKALIGTTFVWQDFPHYVLGSFLGWLWMLGITKISQNNKQP